GGDRRVQAGEGVGVEDDRVDVLRDHLVDRGDLRGHARACVVEGDLLDLRLDRGEGGVRLRLRLDLDARSVAVVAVAVSDDPGTALRLLRGPLARSAGDGCSRPDDCNRCDESAEGDRPTSHCRPLTSSPVRRMVDPGSTGLPDATTQGVEVTDSASGTGVSTPSGTRNRRGRRQRKWNPAEVRVLEAREVPATDVRHDHRPESGPVKATLVGAAMN